MSLEHLLDSYEKNAKKCLEVGTQIDMLDYIEPHHRDQLNHLLNELSGLDYRILQIAHLKTTNQLISALTNIPVAEDMLIVKACGLITAIINKQKQSLHVGLLARLLDWLFAFIKTNGAVGCCDALRTVQVLILANVDSFAQLHERKVSTIVTRLLSMVTKPKTLLRSPHKYDSCSLNEIRLVAVVCLESICTQLSAIDPAIVSVIFDSALGLVSAINPSELDPQNFCILTTALLNICKYVVLLDKSIVAPNIGDLIGLTKSYIMYGLPDIGWMKPNRVNVSQQAIGEPQNTYAPGNKGGKLVKTRKVKSGSKKQSEINKQQAPGQDVERLKFMTVNVRSFEPMTSESDFSESETAFDKKHLRQQAHLRHAALTLIGVVGHVFDPKTLFGYWHSIFPVTDVASTCQHPSSVSLLSAATRDPNPRCRIAALQATMSLLIGSKSFLTRAENSDRAPAAYTPFSLVLGDMVLAMYRALTLAVGNESSLPVLLQVLKCLIVLIQVSTFSRLNTDFIEPIVSHARKLIHNKDPNIQVAALRILQELIASNDKVEIMNLIGVTKAGSSQCKKTKPRMVLPEDEEIELDEEEGYDSDDIVGEPVSSLIAQTSSQECSSDNMSWLLVIALDNLRTSQKPEKTATHKTPVPVRIESLHLLSMMARNFVLLKDHLGVIANAMYPHLTEKDPESTLDIRVNVVKFVDVLGHFINVYMTNEEEVKMNIQNDVFKFWELVLPPLIELIQDETQNNSLRSSACEALSNIGVFAFERLPRFKQIHLIAVLSGSASPNVEFAVRGAAVRALGIYVMFPSLREDMCYIENTTEAILGTLTDGNLEVRVKSSWALGNVTNALLINSSDPSVECINDNQLKRLFVATFGCMNNDKVRSNAVRAIGNLLRLIRSAHLDLEQWRLTVFEAITQIQRNCTGPGHMKVKWNACYAMGNLMHNEALFAPNARPAEWTQLVMPTLCRLVVVHQNFKVRINAAAALAVPTKRADLHDHFGVVWKALLEALEQSDHMTDYAEYQHRDNLVDQLCITIAQYLCMSTAVDMPEISERIDSFGTIHSKWVRVLSRIVPERAASLLSATRHLQTIEVNVEPQRSALRAVKECFVSLETHPH